MVFQNFSKDIIDIIKSDGVRYENLKANVQDGMIFLHRSDVLIQSNDTVIRKISNGDKEIYTVIDAGFKEGSQFNKAHYQMKVKRIDIEEIKKTTNKIEVHNHMLGNNLRVNINSVDLSENNSETTNNNVTASAKIKNN